ncbi:CHAP domain-containing protein [Bifidobacterium scaligerum]|uniref:CHAP domain-containing protein n=1 Tax=Bifidobacterium scaligerum TaxID=2052656 RepID=A0A2M9HPG6_9BIFI|nr:CHAP domain-containing protein [Bifidobacterium scaligerum]PJM78710.1 CHAP domain-containing protein [Bifidobacterium scaligerum]
MTKSHVMKPMLAAVVAGAACLAGLAMTPVIPAQADTYSDLVNAQNQHAASAQREAELKQQLAGANAELAAKVLELDDLTNNKIVAAQAKVTQANEDAATAQDEADAAADRLAAAQKDQATLEEQIKQTGKDYDDAHAAVAQLAREEMHGSNASDVMSVVTGATSTQDFVNSMQSRDALSRNEANAASSAATTLNTSMNRSERLAAIEKQIAVLKTKADEKAASAQTAAETAQSERDALDKLRQQGEEKRNELSALVENLNDESAKQAAQTVLIASQVDSYNRQYQKEQAEAANKVDPGIQGTTTVPSNPTVTPSTPSTPTVTPSMPSTGTGGQGTSNGDYGNAYVAGQCTWWAYDRRKQMGINTPSYLGNGGDWWRTAPSYGLRVDHNPEVGAALSFLPGQDGADGTYGHVAVVEAVNGDGTFVISEMNALAGPFNTNTRTLTNGGQYWFVH